jgi:hypothetical protein
MFRLIDVVAERRWLELPHDVRVQVYGPNPQLRRAVHERAVQEYPKEQYILNPARRSEIAQMPFSLCDLRWALISRKEFKTRILMQEVVLEWSGVADRNGVPLQCTKESVGALAAIEEMAEAFLVAY